MKKFNKVKKMFKGSLVQGTQGGGFSDGGAVGKNTKPNYGGFVGGMTRGFDDGGEVPDDQSNQQTNLVDPSDEAHQQALQQLINPQQLQPNDFTKPGESIPQDAGVGDFIKYNLAHRNPTQDAMSMGLGEGGVENLGEKILPEIDQMAPEAKRAIQDALDRIKGTIQSYGGMPPKPKLSISEEKALENWNRHGKQ